MKKAIINDLEVIELFKAMSPRQIEKLLHTQKKRIYAILDANNIPRKHFNRIKSPPSKLVLEDLYWKQNMSITQTAQSLGLKWSTVKWCMDVYNIPKRTIAQAQKVRYGKDIKSAGTTLVGGYVKVMCKGHPRADRDGYVFEHILVMEKKLGRWILSWESVHHIDGNKSNNSESNLKLISPTDHTLYTKMCAHCELRKRVRLLEWQVKELTRASQYRMNEMPTPEE